MPRTLTVLQFIGSLLRYRAIRAVLWFLASLWLFDRFVYFITEGQWFASVHLENLWWARCRAQTELFCGFLFVSWLLARLFLGPIARLTSHSAPPLRGKLSGFEPARSRVSRLSWVILSLVALLEARLFASHWSDWLYLRGGSHDDSQYMGLPVALWTHTLPILSPFLHALWAFSWFLLAVVAATGTLRALPQLAARQPMPPLSLTRTLWCAVAWLLLLRAALHGTQILALARGRALQSGDITISAPLFALGTLSCLVWSALALRRATGVISRQKFSRMAFGMAVALWLPGILNWLGTPVRSLLGETDTLRKLRQSSTEKAWHLDFATAAAPTRDVTPEVSWPMWDENSLFQVIKPSEFSHDHYVTWRNVTFHYEAGKWHGLLVGEGAGATAWMARRDADASSQLPLDRLDFSPQTHEVSKTPLDSEHIYFGLQGRSLFSENKLGVPIGSMLTKWLWAWRLRDMFLPFDGVGDAHLLVYRGALERAETLVPFWKVAGEPRLVLDGQNPYWMLDICAASSNYPGAMSIPSGPLEGANVASDGMKMLLDARTGEVSFFSVPAPTHDSLLEDWRSTLPGTLKIAGEMPVPLRKEWRAAPAMLAAQLRLLTELKSGAREKSQLYGPQLAFDADSGVVLRSIAVRKKEVDMLESPSGASAERVLRQAKFDLSQRLGAIETAVANQAQPNWLFTSEGDPFVWPDINAPGGYWIGRVFFASSSSDNNKESVTEAKETKWRVALTGALPDSRIGIGPSVSAATLDFLGQNNSTVNGTPHTDSLELQALRAHDAAQEALKNSKWKLFSHYSQIERKLLEQMWRRENNRQ